MGTIISAVLTAATTVVSGVVLFLVTRFLNRQRSGEERRDAEKAQETVLILQSLNALGKLSVANSIALRDGKTNGEMSAALREVEQMENRLYDYLVTSHAGKNTAP